MVADMAADMEVHMVADMEVDNVAAKLPTRIFLLFLADMLLRMVANKVAGMIVLGWNVVRQGGRHGGWHGGRQKRLFSADMEVDMVADKEVDKVADMVDGHRCWLIGPNLFRPQPYLAGASSKPCEFIHCCII